MRFVGLLFLFFAATIFAETPVKDLIAVATNTSACQEIIKFALKVNLVVNVPGEYYCGSALAHGSYIVVDLHHTDESAPATWIGSSLVGYYGIRQTDDLIVEWELAGEEKPGKEVFRPAEQLLRQKRSPD